MKIEHICGHRETHIVFGRGRDREKKIDWLRSTYCGECFKIEKQGIRELNSEIAATDNATKKAVALVGTPVQIAWAERIRKDLFDALNAVAAGELRMVHESTRSSHEVWMSIVEHYLSVSDAGRWIKIYKTALLPIQTNKTPERRTLVQKFAAYALKDEKSAKTIGMARDFVMQQTISLQEQKQAARQTQIDYLTIRGRKLGITGKVQNWTNDRRDLRVYGDKFCFHAKGIREGYFQNKTETASDIDLLDYCNKIVAVGGDVRFKC